MGEAWEEIINRELEIFNVVFTFGLFSVFWKCMMCLFVVCRY
jgi:hypothetical protein